MKRYVRKITFRPTQEMLDVIENMRKDTGLTHSEIIRGIIADYIIFLERTKDNHST